MGSAVWRRTTPHRAAGRGPIADLPGAAMPGRLAGSALQTARRRPVALRDRAFFVTSRRASRAGTQRM
jgi:hypothetical protein